MLLHSNRIGEGPPFIILHGFWEWETIGKHLQSSFQL